MKLNVDGAMVMSASKAYRAGVLRNSNGMWIAGFTKMIGTCSASTME